MSMQVKICGLTSERDIEIVADAGADFAGLILAPSKRQLTPTRAADLARRLPPTTQPVLLFMDQPLDEVSAAVELATPTWVQLHGDESPTFIHDLRKRFPDLRVIKAWSVGDRSAGDALDDYLTVAADGDRLDVVLVDAPKGGAHPGFACLAAVAARVVAQNLTVWCAGGLTADNLAAGAPAKSVHGVDVARGVESAPGVKDADLVRAFVTAARQILPAQPPGPR